VVSVEFITYLAVRFINTIQTGQYDMYYAYPGLILCEHFINKQ